MARAGETPTAAPVTGAFAGYGAAPLGTRWERVKALFPTAEELPSGKTMGAAVIGGPFVHRLYLVGQHVDGLAQPVDVELRFWKKKLWVVQYYVGDNADQDVLAWLTRRLGPNPSGDPQNPLWTTETVQITVSFAQRWVGVTDLALSADAQRWLKQAMRGEWTAPSPQELDEMEGRPRVPTPAGGA